MSFAIYDNLERDILEVRRVEKGEDPIEVGRRLVRENHPELSDDEATGEWGRWGRIEKQHNEITVQNAK